MDVCHQDMARSMHGEDASKPTDSVEPGSGGNVTSALIKPNIVLPGSEQPAPSLVVLSADAAGSV